jgi:hypothetical protein
MTQQIEVNLTDKQIKDFLKGHEVPQGIKLDIGQRLQWETMRAVQVASNRLGWLMFIGVLILLVLFIR